MTMKVANTTVHGQGRRHFSHYLKIAIFSLAALDTRIGWAERIEYSSGFINSFQITQSISASSWEHNLLQAASERKCRQIFSCAMEDVTAGYMDSSKKQSSKRVKYVQIRIMEDVARRLSDPGVHYSNKQNTVLEINKYLDNMKVSSPSSYSRVGFVAKQSAYTDIAKQGPDKYFEEVLTHLRSSKVVAVLRGGHPDRLFRRGVELAEMHGCNALEVALDSYGSMEVLEELALVLPSSCLLGAATVITEKVARKAARAGARFVTSPIGPPDFVKWCEEEGSLAIPAGFTPSELHQLLESGAKAIKLFPACSFSASGLKQVSVHHYRASPNPSEIHSPRLHGAQSTLPFPTHALFPSPRMLTALI
jgi:2-keto-3-deoxy-6-phosphogluconate aldolase